MLNLLIAMMSDTYEGIKEQADKEVQKLKAETIIRVQRRMLACSRGNTHFPAYLQVLVPEIRTRAFAAVKRSDPWSSTNSKAKEQNLMDQLQDDVQCLQQDVGKMRKMQQDVGKMQQDMGKVLELLEAISSQWNQVRS
jgi:hypothetical protein